MAQVDMFLKIDGIDGEAQDDKHKNEIAITSYSMAGSPMPARCGSGMGSRLRHGVVR